MSPHSERVGMGLEGGGNEPLAEYTMRSKDVELLRFSVTPHLYPPVFKCQHSLSSFVPLESVSQLSLSTLSPALTNPHDLMLVALKYQPTPLALCVSNSLLPVSKVTSLRAPAARSANVSLPVGRQDSINKLPVH